MFVGTLTNYYLSPKLYYLKALAFTCSCLFFLLLVSCKNEKAGQGHGPIVLGDSATIVTEKDSGHLRDMVMDMEARQTIAVPEPKVAPPKEEVVEKAPARSPVTPEADNNAKGFILDFGTVQMKITGIKTTEYQKQDPVKDAGLSYACTEGDIAGSDLIMSGMKNVKIEQRYQTQLHLKSSLGEISLRNLGLATSDWKEIKGRQSGATIRFDLSSLKKPEFNKISNRALKNALEKELRRQRAGRSTEQKWLSEIRRTRSAKDKPCEIILHDVQWRISGTDSKGRNFHKTIRLDAKAV
jgi:hypothetical protein